MVNVEALYGSLLEVEVDAIVIPTNSLGLMGGGVSYTIKIAGGQQIEEEAIKKAPIPVGGAILTTAGKPSFKGVIHAPTMEWPATETREEKVRKAVKASLELADRMGFESIAMPGMGTGVGKLPKDIAAGVMIEELRAFIPKNLRKVILVDINPQMVEEWEKLL